MSEDAMHESAGLDAVLVANAENPLWYKDAVIYQLHVKSFFDSNNDGIGDFKGLMERLDYISDLGVTAVWLLPFYPSPRRDDGYDISEYCDVSPDYGTMEDVRAFIAAAHARGLRVITELIINHTSDQHPWFQAARKAPPGSPEREFYVWSDSDEKYAGTRIIFLDTEKSNWTWDEEAQAFFWHRFYSHQPDLNFDNPRVLEEVLRIMHFWLDAGIDGLRLDAIPYLVEREGTSNENLPETHAILRRIRADLDANYPGRFLLAEANMWPEDTQQYFGETGDECHMAFHFPLMPRMYMAVAQEDRFPITDIMRQTPDIPEQSQWAIFLRNHDELTLEMVTDAERDYLWNTYAADRRARINLGIRRRLAPLLERDRRRVELTHALLLTMPGTPVMYYGDEISMGDNIFLGDRDGVRTPMQWSPDRNGGFSKADPAALTLPVIQDPLYGFASVNVEAQQRDAHSMLNWVKRMLAVRKQYQVFGRGTQTFIRPRNRKILAYLREYQDETMLCVANLSRTAQAGELDLSAFAGRVPIELTGGIPFPRIGSLPYLLTLPPYAFYWFRLTEDVEAPDWSTSAPMTDVELHTFVLRPGLSDAVTGRNGEVLARDILPDYIAQRRWFGAKNARIESVAVARWAELPGEQNVMLTEVEVTTAEGTGTYTLPLGVAWEGEAHGPFAPNLAFARARRGRHVGLLTDGFTLHAFPKAVVKGLRDRLALPTRDGEIVFEPSDEFDLAPETEVEWLAAEQSNSTLVLGDVAVIKLLRKIEAGIHPEVEMTGHLRAKGFQNVPPLYGEVRRVDAEGRPHTLMMAQGFVRNQGDGWRWTLDALSRAAAETAPIEEDGNPVETYDAFAGTLGRRLAEMHQLLAEPSDDRAFAPEPIGAEACAALAERIVAQVHEAAGHAERAGLDPETHGEHGRWLAENADALARRIGEVARAAEGIARTRIHGDLHLGQLLVTGADIMLIDFEGEPARTMDERRAKDLAVRDVAGILRSFSYAAAAAARELPAMPETEQERADVLFARFEASARERFLEAYMETAPAVSRELVDLFVLEKAAYEVRYEAANRPAWLPIPLAGLVASARRLMEGDVS